MKEIEEILRDLSQKNVTIPQQIEHRINYTLKTKQKNTYNYKIKKLLTTTISIVLVLLGSSGLVYGLTTAYEYFMQKTAVSNYSYDYKEDMKYMNRFYYKKITNFSDYLKYKEKMSNLIEMTEEDFKDNFLLIIISTSPYMPGIYVSNIETDDNILYVEIDRDNERERQKEILSVKISNELDREYINVDRMKKIPKSDDYVPLEELPKDYSKEQAILDNCVVIYNSEVISNNKLRIEEFVENTNNNKEDFIRIVRVQDKIDYSMSIFDIQYIDNEYRVYLDQTRCNDEEIQGYIYNTYSKIELSSYNMNEKLTKIELTNHFKEKLCVGFYFDK